MPMPCLERSWQRADEFKPVLYTPITANPLFHDALPAAPRPGATAISAHRSAKKSPAREISVFPPDTAIFCGGGSAERLSSLILEDKSLPSSEMLSGRLRPTS